MEGLSLSGLLGMLTGSAAAKAQAQQREQMKVDQARQLQTMNEDTQRTGLVRKNPRGRRLLADASTSGLPTTVA
jgi:hypothetical protein